MEVITLRSTQQYLAPRQVVDFRELSCVKFAGQGMRGTSWRSLVPIKATGKPQQALTFLAEYRIGFNPCPAVSVVYLDNLDP